MNTLIKRILIVAALALSTSACTSSMTSTTHGMDKFSVPSATTGAVSSADVGIDYF